MPADHAATIDTRANTARATRLVVARGKGARVNDVDGNEYIDFALGGGANILGHADERVVAAISKAASKGFGFSDPSEAQVRLAEMIIGRFASIDLVFLTHSRARAIASAIRVARATTGRKGVLVVRGSVAEEVVRTTDVGCTLLETTSNRGGSNQTAPEHTFVVEPGLPTVLEQRLDANGSSMAAVVIEPFSVSTGVCAPPDGHLETLRRLCDQYGALLVFDDSVSGLRMGSNGAEGVTDVAPDLTCFGSELSAGLPLAALGGRKDVMKHAGTRAGLNTVGDAPADDLALAAGIAVLEALAEPGFYDALNEQTLRLAEGFRTALSSVGEACEVHCVGSLVGVGSPTEQNAGPTGNTPVTSTNLFFDTLLNVGILPPFVTSAPWAVSAAHGPDEIDRAVEAFGAALNTIRM